MRKISYFVLEIRLNLFNGFSYKFEITGLINEITGLINEITGLINEITGLINEITGLIN